MAQNPGNKIHKDTFIAAEIFCISINKTEFFNFDIILKYKLIIKK